MKSKDEIKVQVDDINTFFNDKYVGFVIEWSGNVGFGEYTIYRSTKGSSWHADSECMDDNEDKSFLKKLFEDLIEQITID